MLSAMLALAWAMPTAMVAPHVAYAQAASCVLSGGRIIIIGGKAICFPPASNACPVTVGTLTLAPVVTRSSGISPLLVFFDATASTDSATLGGANTVFQDVNFAWMFGDGSSVSGSGATWLFGSNPNGNSRNTATGGMAAHLFIVPDGSGDQTYNIQAVAFDGTNTASCNLSVTAFDPSGANGFPGSTTTCVAATTTPVAGSGGCPSGASVLQTSSLTTAASSTNLGSGKRVLLKCGDSFSGDTPTITATTFSLGAYGSCPGTQTSRPILSGHVIIGSSSVTAVDGRVSDFDFESVGGNAALNIAKANQITGYNLLSNGNNESYYCQQCAQDGLVQVVQTGEAANQGTFWNFGENNCVNGSQLFNCGGTPVYNNIDYNAMLGSNFNGSFNGTGSPPTSGPETVRTSGGSRLIIENSTFLNATSTTAVLKQHSGNTFGSDCQWIGYTSSYWQNSDNFYGGSPVGAEMVENVAQNAVTDERIQFVVEERNIFSPSSNTSGQLLIGAMNSTVRDNVFLNSGGASFGNRGFQGTSNSNVAQPCSGTGTTAAPVLPLYPTGDEAYNNTCDGSQCIKFGGGNGVVSSANNSFLQNTLTFNSSAVSNGGSGNVVANNSPTTTANPGFVNASGTFSVISDWKPTANFTISCTPFPGCTAVPVKSDALGIPWSPTWDLGAVHH